MNLEESRALRAKGTVVFNDSGRYAFTRELIGFNPVVPDLLEPLDNAPPVPQEGEAFSAFLATLRFERNGKPWKLKTKTMMYGTPEQFKALKERLYRIMSGEDAWPEGVPPLDPPVTRKQRNFDLIHPNIGRLLK